jgi:SAM-dependent methyltransferase
MLDWDHNAYYHRLLLRQLPRQCNRMLDVGCGAGSFAARLAQRADQVDAIDRSAAMIELAKTRTPDNVNCIHADALTEPLPSGYDAIVSISALHHMPLQDALERFATLLRPGGVLAAVALPRRDLPRELPTEVVAAVGFRLPGSAFAAARTVGSNDWFAKDQTHTTKPVVLDPPLTTRQARDLAKAPLPGVEVRRHTFWRYLLRWQKPTNQAK